ncbi:MAG: DNA polymerase III subunit delta' [Gammaproteobacteria bacterium]
MKYIEKYIWLQPAYQAFLGYIQQQRLPHALMISGPAGIGKSLLAKDFARTLLCRQPDENGIPCGECSGCHLFDVGTHPDFLEVSPEESGKAIRVDQIREMCANLSLTSHAAGYKVVIISPADAMNNNAANSLLKTLEEPTDNTLVLLEVTKPERLPVTVRSRCQTLVCEPPDRQTALSWLQQEQVGQGISHEISKDQLDILLDLANGAPLEAIRLNEAGQLETWQTFVTQLVELIEGGLAPAKLLAAWNKDQILQLLGWLRAVLIQLIRADQLGYKAAVDQKSAVVQTLAGYYERADVRKLHALLQKCDRTHALLVKHSGLNRVLLFEEILILWTTIFTANQQMRA